MQIKTREDRRQRIKFRIRKRVAGDQDRPRLTVYRSLSHMYVQVIDDMTGNTVASAATNEPKLKSGLAGKTRGGNIAGAQLIHWWRGSAGADRFEATFCNRPEQRQFFPVKAPVPFSFAARDQEAVRVLHARD